MIIQPKIRGFICTTAHPLGCARMVLDEINYIKAQPKISGPKNVLVIGASTGYGLASRICSTFSAGAKTLGVFFEKAASDKRTATAGWYNTAAFEKFAKQDGYYAKSINGDAFSQEIKDRTAQLIKDDLGQIDLLIYSLAAPRRIHPVTGQIYNSVLKPINKEFQGKTVDVFKGEIKDINIPPASEADIENTVAVMGGEDWQMWIDFLAQHGLLSEDFITVSYSYLGPQLTHAIYKDGTIGKAKEDLKKHAVEINTKLIPLAGKAFVSVNKAVVTQASAAIPVVPLYISILFKLMKAKGTHEGCIEQIYRLFKDYLYAKNPLPLDEEGYIRIDNLEMDQDIQNQISKLWDKVNTENVMELTDLLGYQTEFYQLFGFKVPGVNYDEDIDPDVRIQSVGDDSTNT